MTEPTLTDVLTRSAENQRRDIHTAIPARIVSCNGHTATVEILINHLKKNGSQIELPPLVDVPVGFFRGGGFCITVPLKQGDEGLAIFSERCIDGWYESGEKSAPLDNRFHDLSDAFFFPQGSSKPNKIPDYSSEALSIQSDSGDTYFRMLNGKILINADIEHTGNSTQIGNAVVNGNHSVIGNSESTGGTLKHNGKNIGSNHTHNGVETGSGSTGEPN